MKKMKKWKKVLLIVGAVIVGIVVLMGIYIFSMMNKINNLKNEDIDMNRVADGIYTGESDGGLVKVEVEVTVLDHKIENIKLVKHQNGKGEDAESMIDVMIANNTDDVDAVSGATASSKTIRNAVNVALQKGLK